MWEQKYHLGFTATAFPTRNGVLLLELRMQRSGRLNTLTKKEAKFYGNQCVHV